MTKKTPKIYPYTVVYVYAPELYKDDYMAGKSIPNIKLGETKSEADDRQTCMEAAMKRINQLSTSFKEYMYLLLWFVFPYKKDIDDEIRLILTENIYHLTSSKKIDYVDNHEDQRKTKIGLEFAYDINIALVNTAISVYKLKSKMEELINDRGIDPAFKKRLRLLIDEMLENLDDVVDESANKKEKLPIAEQIKINMQSRFEEMEPTF